VINVHRSATVNGEGPHRRSRTSASALRCLDLLEAMSSSQSPVGVSELARTVGWPRGSVHLQLATLVKAGWVEQIDTGRYRLSLTPIRIGQAALAQADLGSRVLPTMEELAHDTGETVSISVLDGDSALIVQRVDSGHVLRIDLRIGTRMPLDTSASGRVLVAFATPAQLAAARASGVRLPTRSILARVRATGIAASVDEYLVGIAAVAAPVRDAHDRTIGALSVAGPTPRISPGSLSGAVREAANAMTRIMRGER